MENLKNHSQNNVLDNVPPIFEDPASLLPMLQSVYKGTDVIDVVMQLLSIYKVQGGISAYESVLLTLSSLFKDFSRNERQRLISMVPPPKDVSIELVKSTLEKAMESFKCTTPLSNYSGVYYHNIPENMYDTTSITTEEIKKGKNNEISNKMDSNNLITQCKYYTPIQCKKVPQLIPSVPNSFQDPSLNQSPLVCTNMKSMNHLYTDYNQLQMQPCLAVRPKNALNNRQHADSTVYRQNFFKPVCNRYLSLPITEMTGCDQFEVSYLGDSYQNVYTNYANHANTIYGSTHNDCLWKLQGDNSQNVCCNKNLYINNDVTFGVTKQEIGKPSTSCAKEGSSSYLFLPVERNKEQRVVLQSNNAYIDKEQIFLGEEFQRNGKSIIKERHTVQEDNYKMDFVCWKEQDMDIRYEEQAPHKDYFETEHLIPSNELKIGIQNFLKRIKQEVFIEVPGFPQTRPLHISLNPSYVVPSESDKSVVVQQAPQNNKKPRFLVGGVKRPEVLQTSLTSNSIGSRNLNNTVYRTKSETTSKPKSQKINEDYIMGTFLESCDSDCTLNKLQTVTTLDERNNAEDLSSRCTETPREESTLNFSQHTTSNASRTAVCKKKFYNMLLDVQNAKVASSIPSTKSGSVSNARCDSYYSGYSYRQLSQHRGQLIGSQQQFPGLTKTHGSPYTWLDSNNPNHSSSPGESRVRQKPSSSHSSGHE